MQEDFARLETKLETVQGKLEEKTKQSVEKNQKIKQVYIHVCTYAGSTCSIVLNMIVQN